MVSRGPDGEGYLVTNNFDFCKTLKSEQPGALVINLEHKYALALGHKRLAITDLSDKAAQPMTVDGNRYWIVFNVQIYNQVKLRKELENKALNLKPITQILK